MDILAQCRNFKNATGSVVAHVSLENDNIPCNLNKITINCLDLKKFKYF